MRKPHQRYKVKRFKERGTLFPELNKLGKAGEKATKTKTKKTFNSYPDQNIFNNCIIW
jgi:hypothetical protein